MSVQSTDDWQTDRTFKLYDDVAELIGNFSEVYDRPTVEDQLWSARVVALMEARIAVLRESARSRSTDMPLEERSSIESAPRSTPIAIETFDVTLDPASQEMKQQSWLELWSKVEAVIAEFEAEHTHAAPFDRRWAAHVAEEMRAQVSAHRDLLQREHPDMPTIPEQPAAVIEIDILEALFAPTLVDGVDPDGDVVDDVDETVRARSGLERAEFIAARGRLRAIIEELPAPTRARTIALLLSERRRRN